MSSDRPSMSLGSIFTTVGSAALRLVFGGPPSTEDEASDARRAAISPDPAIIASETQDRQKISDARRSRQYLRADSVTPLFMHKYRHLWNFGQRHTPAI
jgi:hypothetical protein